MSSICALAQTSLPAMKYGFIYSYQQSGISQRLDGWAGKGTAGVRGIERNASSRGDRGFCGK